MENAEVLEMTVKKVEDILQNRTQGQSAEQQFIYQNKTTNSKEAASTAETLTLNHLNYKFKLNC